MYVLNVFLSDDLERLHCKAKSFNYKYIRILEYHYKMF